VRVRQELDEAAAAAGLEDPWLAAGIAHEGASPAQTTEKTPAFQLN
jgi:hypothetical protein